MHDLLLPLLLLVPGVLHEVHQQERLHHDGDLRAELLLSGGRVVLIAHAECCKAKTLKLLNAVKHIKLVPV